MYNAMKFGYNFNIIKGYLFENGNIFKEYIERLYKLRLQYPKTDPCLRQMNQIAKLLQNW